MRAVLDVNVVISAALSSGGTPARLLRAWQEGRFELIASPLLLAELERAFAYAKIQRRIGSQEAAAVVDLIRRVAIIRPDPSDPPPVHSIDPGDDYLLALAASEDAVLVSGDEHLLALRGESPVHSPASFHRLLEEQDPGP